MYRRVAVGGGGETEVLAEGAAFVGGAEAAAALEFGDDELGEVVEGDGEDGGADVEAVGGGGVEPVLHLVGNGFRGADDQAGAEACGDADVELADGKVVAPGHGDEAVGHGADLGVGGSGTGPSRS